MHYFITGATGFIGSRLAERLLARDGAVLYFLVRAHKLAAVDTFRARWGVGPERAIPVVGDLVEPHLGITQAERERLHGRIGHFFHLAAVYDLRASAEAQERANVQGTRHAARLADEIEDYAWKLWDYWERHLDPDLFVDRSLKGAVQGKVVMITGSGQGIGKAAAQKIAAAGATLLLVNREADQLAQAKQEIENAVGRAIAYRCDLTDFDQVDPMIAQVLCIRLLQGGHGCVRALCRLGAR